LNLVVPHFQFRLYTKPSPPLLFTLSLSIPNYRYTLYTYDTIYVSTHLNIYDYPHLSNMSQQHNSPYPTPKPTTSPPPPPPPTPPPPPPAPLSPPPPPPPPHTNTVHSPKDQSQHSQPTIGIESLPSPKKVKTTAAAAAASSSVRPAGGKHPIYRGIRSRGGKWVSEIREPKKTTRVWLGTYPSPEMAAAAYDVAALALKGPATAVNFPDRVGEYPVPASPSPSDIRKAAASAAALMKPEEEAPPVDETAAADGNAETAAGEHEFIDEEALFHMPNLLVDMAEGMLVSPPRMASPPSEDSPDNSDVESLWSY
ncbi:ethylene-responsive transcription factor ERF026-like, partial [Salvia miltiorrhiza]|uniref:ethylene-responsive transcription factor ERF026-like n=1 Tax=Salvia miltiorrhiza TaxID=226208 RepID=UPI0025ABB91C